MYSALLEFLVKNHGMNHLIMFDHMDYKVIEFDKSVNQY